MRYFALGGSQSLLEVDAYLHGLTPLPRADRDMLAHAVNERLDELHGPPKAPYSRLVPEKPLHGPLRGLVELLEGTHRAPPERLPTAVAAAARALDVRIGVYLADYEQRLLVPLPPAGSETLDIATTVAGDVFRRVGSAVTRDDGRPVLWTVLLDGVERLGVLEIEPLDGTDPDDPVLRQQSHWLATLLGHLVTIVTQYGDGLDVHRRRRHRASPAELLWQALPPLTGATGAVVVGASVQPAYDLCATGFDYALSEHRAWLALVDAGPRDAAASLVVVSALSAYRAARRDGGTLDAQHAAVCQSLEARPAAAATVAELDLHTGDLHCLTTGTGAPAFIRCGEPDPKRLRPGDLFALCSRGALDTANEHGERFGRADIAAALRRHSGLPAPEIARRIVAALTDHHGGQLPGDVAVVVTRWTPPELIDG
ncbi:PP2C family protein-serine/threonine phosphatase [Amycolatopsis solani]|uniref:PP2C family protein-serine/threonine phosphatase n=1 Tax=Amycolatopsis solani TaxID=3028615 RepID=UPI0025AFDEF0|nr:SpoIIE family protein phosphatase [Amycolatopsis sp. MEP2-6]